jgi:gamma-glutamylputrescine oxidase
MAAPYIDTYYRDTLHTDIKRPSLKEAKHTNVCVIGGGFAGLSTALGLAERGRNVVVLEANRIGWGASGRNGGFATKGFAKSHKDLAYSVGVAHARALNDVALAGRALIKQRIAQYNIDCGPIIDGVMGVSWNDDPKATQDYVDFMGRDMGVPLIYWPKEKIRHFCKTDQYFDGYFSPDDFQFHPLNYVHGLADAIESHSGVIHEDTQAISISGDEGQYIVETPQGSVYTDQVVLCCSIHVGNLDKRLKYASFPVHTYVMVTRPIPEEILDKAINTRYAIYDNRFAQDYYRRLPDNRILWGGRVSLKDQPKGLGEIMIRDLLKIYPQLAKHAKADYAWSGDMCYAPHKMPQLGEIKPGYWYCTGFGGHGVVPTAGCGDVVARAIADRDETYRLFEPFSKLNFAGGPLSPYIAQSIYYLWRVRDLFMKK